MKSKPSADNKAFWALRQQAEEAVRAAGEKIDQKGSTEMMRLFQELQVQQIELEMQNDELRIVNEELELQQQKFAGIYDLAPIGYFILDEAGVIGEVNNAGISLLGSGRASLTGKRLQQFVTAEQKDSFYRFFRQMLLTRTRQNCQLKMCPPDSDCFDAQVQGIAIAAGAQIQCYLAVIDISESISSKQHLAETSERLELALEAAAASIWELDTETMALHSPELSRLSAGRFEHTYLSFLELLDPEDREAVDQHFRTALNHETEIDIVCRIRFLDDQAYYYNLRGHLVRRRASESFFVGILMDITDKKRAEAEAIRLRQDQQRDITLATLKTQENERKRISDALHDGVSQLLYGIKIKLGLPDMRTPGSGAMRSMQQLLDMAIEETRNISFELAPSILNDFGLATTVEELAKRLSSDQLRIKTKCIGLQHRLDLNLETCIFRIVQELINNCMKHADTNAVLIEIKKNKHIEIRVEDNGKGFHVKEQEIKPGGAGLSSIKNRLSLYNGTMQINSAPGKGTQVRITLQEHPTDRAEA